MNKAHSQETPPFAVIHAAPSLTLTLRLLTAGDYFRSAGLSAAAGASVMAFSWRWPKPFVRAATLAGAFLGLTAGLMIGPQAHSINFCCINLVLIAPFQATMRCCDLT